MAEQEKRPDSVMISTGTLFCVRDMHGEMGRTDVILDIGEGQIFDVVNMKYDDQGQPYWTPYSAATGSPENFGSIVGQMTVDELIEAGQRGFARAGPITLGDKIITLLHENAARGSRVLILSNH